MRKILSCIFTLLFQCSIYSQHTEIASTNSKISVSVVCYSKQVQLTSDGTYAVFILKIKNNSDSVLRLPHVLHTNTYKTDEDITFEILYFTNDTINYTDSIKGLSVSPFPTHKAKFDSLKKGDEKLIEYYLPSTLPWVGKYKIRFGFNTSRFIKGFGHAKTDWVEVEVIN